MINNIKRGLFPTLITISALAVSTSAAYYSVSGLSKLFAGASLEVVIMASSLEVSKLVIASLLYRYWNTINKVLKVYLTMAATILILITSIGIYGFLSAAYQETYSEISIVENKKAYIQQKVDFYETDLQRFDEELESILSNINTLSAAKSGQTQVRDTTSSTGYRTVVSTAGLRLAQKRIDVEEENRKSVQIKRQVTADSLQKLQLEILELQNSSDQAGELGPLKYLAGLTNTSMDKIINILILLLVFVFDPLAISLVVAANFAFEKAYPKKKFEDNLYGEKEEIKEWDHTLQDGLEDEEWDEDHALDEVMNEMVKDLDIRDIEVVDEVDVLKELNNSKKIDNTQYKKIRRVLQKAPSKWRVEFTDDTTGWVDKNTASNNPNKIRYM